MKNKIKNFIIGFLLGGLSVSTIGYALAQDVSNLGNIGILFQKSTAESNGHSQNSFRLFGENIQDETIGTIEFSGDSVETNDIKNNSIKSIDIEERNIFSKHIKDGTIKSSNINSSYALWNKNPDGNLYYNNGDVGIGINSPQAKFQVVGGDANINGITVGRGGGNRISNTVIGNNSFKNNINGIQNLVIGANTGNGITNGNNNIIIGNNVNTPANGNNILNIGDTIIGTTGSNAHINIPGELVVEKVTKTNTMPIDENSDPKTYITKSYLEKLTDGYVYLQNYTSRSFNTDYAVEHGGYLFVQDDIESNASCLYGVYVNGKEITKSRTTNSATNTTNIGLLIPQKSKFKVIQVGSGCDNAKLKFAEYGIQPITGSSNPNVTVSLQCSSDQTLENGKCVNSQGEIELVYTTTKQNNHVELPFFENVNLTSIDWGDGGINNCITTYKGYVNHQMAHGYAIPQITCTMNNITSPTQVTVKVRGTFDRIITGKRGVTSLSEARILKILKWKNTKVKNLSHAFSMGHIGLPYEMDTSTVTDMSHMFQKSSFNQPINHWDTSNVTNMSGMFSHNSSFNQPLNNWDTSKVTDMSGMFAITSFNQPLNNWDTSKVTDMHSMFYLNRDFNQPINSWDTSKVTNMSTMFTGALAFNQSLSNWNTENVTNMDTMFSLTNGSGDSIMSFRKNLACWDVSKVTNRPPSFATTPIIEPIWGTNGNGGTCSQ